MKLIKVTDGLLEAEQFSLASSFPDYFNKNDIIIGEDNNVIINSNNKIERNVFYSEFLIEISKNNWDDIQEDENFLFYIGVDENIYGIQDNLINGQSLYQKIIYNDNYLQTYVSEDKQHWNNLGGLRIKSISRQGFKKSSPNPVVLKEYKIYRNPYITIQNFSKNVKVELYDEADNKVKERFFNENLECTIFLDYCMKGYLKFYDTNSDLLYTSDVLDLQYGDVYCYSNYELELEYKNRTLTDIPTCLEDPEELIILKNVSIDKTYYNLKLFAETPYDDTILLSLDGESFGNNVVISKIKPNDKIDIYIRIVKGKTNHNFVCRDFELKLEQL